MKPITMGTLWRSVSPVIRVARRNPNAPPISTRRKIIGIICIAAAIGYPKFHQLYFPIILSLLGVGVAIAATVLIVRRLRRW